MLSITSLLLLGWFGLTSNEALAVMTVIAVGFAIAYFLKDSGKSLQRKFARFGKLKGLHKTDIIDEVGRPNSISSLPDGKTLLQWMRGSYHIGLIFDGDRCEGVQHEASHDTGA